MIFNRYFQVGLLSMMFVVLALQPAKSQVGDSLTLSAIIGDVVQNHPAVKKAMEEINVSDAKIGFAKSGNLPVADFSSTYSRLGPTSEITIPGMGSFSIMSPNNYNAAVSVNQMLYDFGKTANSVQLEKQGKELAIQSVEAVRQKLSQAVVASYYTLLYLQEAIKIKDEQLKNLNEHLQSVKKKQETGSATQYEILTTQVRISAIENQKTDLETARKIQICQLNSMLGKPESTMVQVKKELLLQLPEKQTDGLIADALQNRDEMKLANEKAKLTDMRYKLVHSQNNAAFNAFATGGLKNGYLPKLDNPKANYVVGVGVKVPLYDGKRMKYNLDQVESAKTMNDLETEIARRNIVNEVVESNAMVEASMKKVDQCKLQLQQAKQAYELGKIRFNSGSLTNLELLDGSTAISESELLLLKSQIDFTVNRFKLKMAVGERLYK